MKFKIKNAGTNLYNKSMDNLIFFASYIIDLSKKANPLNSKIKETNKKPERNEC